MLNPMKSRRVQLQLHAADNASRFGPPDRLQYELLNCMFMR